MKKKAVSVFWLILLVLFQLIYGIETKTQENSDEFLEFVLKTSQSPNNDHLLFLVGEAYETLGYHTRAMELFFQLDTEHSKYKLLKVMINSNSMLSISDLQSIEKQISVLKDKSKIINLYFDLIHKYTFVNKNEIASKIASKCQRLIKGLINNDPESEEIFLLMDLSFLLYKTHLDDQAGKILEEVKNLLSKINDSSIIIEVFEYLVYGFIELNNEKMAMLYAERLINLLKKPENIKNLFNLNFIETLIALGKENAARELNGLILEKKGTKEFIRMMNHFMIKSSKLLFSENSWNKLISSSEIETMGPENIQIMIEMGFPDKCRDLAKKIDLKDRTGENMDFYYYYMSRKLLNESQNRITKFSIINLANKIRNTDKKNSLLLEIANHFMKLGDQKTFLDLLKQVSKFQKGKDFEIQSGKQYLSLLWLKAGYNGIASKLIENTDDTYEKSAKLFQMGSHFVSQGKIKKACEVLKKFGYDSVFKALLLSKIASFELKLGYRIKGIKLFKESFNLLQNNTEERVLKIPGVGDYMLNLENILNDYLNSLEGNRNQTLSKCDLEMVKAFEDERGLFKIENLKKENIVSR